MNSKEEIDAPKIKVYICKDINDIDNATIKSLNNLQYAEDNSNGNLFIGNSILGRPELIEKDQQLINLGEFFGKEFSVRGLYLGINTPKYSSKDSPKFTCVYLTNTTDSDLGISYPPAYKNGSLNLKDVEGGVRIQAELFWEKLYKIFDNLNNFKSAKVVDSLADIYYCGQRI